MKILSPKEYGLLKQKADNYDSIVAKIVAKNSELKAEDVTPEAISTIVDNATSDTENELNNQLSEAQKTIQSQNQTIETNSATISQLQTEVKELKGTGAESPANVDKQEELNANESDVADYCSTHSYSENVAYLKKEGII